MPLQETENVPGQPYPTTTHTNIYQHPTHTNCQRDLGRWGVYLHCDDSVIDDCFFGEEVCTDGCFVLGAELFVYLNVSLGTESED